MKKNKQKNYEMRLPGKDGMIVYEADFPGHYCVGTLSFDYELSIPA